MDIERVNNNPLSRKKLQVVALQDIDIASFPFSCSFPLTSAKLLLSIRRVGLITPVILRSQQKGKNQRKLEVVAGAKRISACRNLGLDTVEAFVYPGDSLDDQTAFTLNIMDNSVSKSLNIMEIAITLQKLVYFIADRENIRSNFLPLLGLESGDLLLHKYIQLLALIPDLQDYVVTHDLPLNIAYELTQFTPEDQTSLLKLFSQMPFNRNKMREVITNLKEVCERDRIAPDSILQAKEIEEIVMHEKISPIDKCEAIRQFLKKLRYPTVTAHERKMNQYTHELRLPRQMKLSLPAYLEGGSLKIELEVKKPSDLLPLGQKLLEISQAPALTKILEFL